MRILVLGITGQLGHTLGLYFSHKLHDVIGIGRKEEKVIQDKIILKYGKNSNGQKLFDKITYIQLMKFTILSIDSILQEYQPDIIFNCVGIVKQKENVKVKEFIEINSVFPKQLQNLITTKYSNLRLIHFSTDCIYSGSKGDYKLTDLPDPTEWYGISKYLGELTANNITTIRTSIIGPEIFNKVGLFEWLLSMKGKKVYGYSNNYWSGLTTLCIAEYFITNNFKLNNGIMHYSTDSKISKYKLLVIINKIFDLNINIVENDQIILDRSLISSINLGLGDNAELTYEKVILKLYNWILYLQNGDEN